MCLLNIIVYYYFMPRDIFSLLLLLFFFKSVGCHLSVFMSGIAIICRRVAMEKDCPISINFRQWRDRCMLAEEDAIVSAS